MAIASRAASALLLLLPPLLLAEDAPPPLEPPPPGVSCGQQTSTLTGSTADGFDEVTLLQQEVEGMPGAPQKSTQEWLEHYKDHRSNIGADQRVLHNDTVAGQLSKAVSGPGACHDDPMWRDADGDGCEIYRFAIQSGKVAKEAACNGGGEVPATPGLRGARKMVVADATAKVFCPMTCGMCQPPPEMLELAAQEHGAEELDDVSFLQIGVSSASGVSKKSVQSWEEHAYDHKSRITADQHTVDNETVAFRKSQLQNGECSDDPMWRDADGDGCEIYKFAIESGKTTRTVACGGGGENPPSRALRGRSVVVVADATAWFFCPSTCGAC